MFLLCFKASRIYHLFGDERQSSTPHKLIVHGAGEHVTTRRTLCYQFNLVLLEVLPVIDRYRRLQTTVLLYGLECFSVAKYDVKSLDFAVTRFLMKLFRSSNINVIDECRMFFNFMLPSEKIEKRRIGFQSKFSNCTSLLYYFNICP